MERPLPIWGVGAFLVWDPNSEVDAEAENSGDIGVWVVGSVKGLPNEVRYKDRPEVIDFVRPVVDAGRRPAAAEDLFQNGLQLRLRALLEVGGS